MWLSDLEPLFQTSPWIAGTFLAVRVLALGIHAAERIILVSMIVKRARPEDLPKVMKEVAPILPSRGPRVPN
jgi:hypothetical protein